MTKEFEQEEMIEDIKDRLSKGEELRDVARRYGMSCRMVCRLMAENPEKDPDVLDLSKLDLGEPLEPFKDGNLEFEYT